MLNRSVRTRDLARAFRFYRRLGIPGVSAAPAERLFRNLTPAAPERGTTDVPRVRETVPGETSPAFSEKKEQLRELRQNEIGECVRCVLARGRKNIVFGTGNPGAELMFVGEGPGADEDMKGLPFVGRAGELLTKMINAMGKRRGEVYIASIVKCRPPGNRDPRPDEIAVCIPFLHRQIEVIAPRAIVTLGQVAAQALLETDAPIGQLRGRPQEFRGIYVMPTYHPAYLLRSPGRKRLAWEDLKGVMARLGWEVPAG